MILSSARIFLSPPPVVVPPVVVPPVPTPTSGSPPAALRLSWGAVTSDPPDGPIVPRLWTWTVTVAHSGQGSTQPMSGTVWWRLERNGRIVLEHQTTVTVAPNGSQAVPIDIRLETLGPAGRLVVWVDGTSTSIDRDIGVNLPNRGLSLDWGEKVPVTAPIAAAVNLAGNRLRHWVRLRNTAGLPQTNVSLDWEFAPLNGGWAGLPISGRALPTWGGSEIEAWASIEVPISGPGSNGTLRVWVSRDGDFADVSAEISTEVSGDIPYREGEATIRSSDGRIANALSLFGGTIPPVTVPQAMVDALNRSIDAKYEGRREQPDIADALPREAAWQQARLAQRWRDVDRPRMMRNRQGAWSNSGFNTFLDRIGLSNASAEQRRALMAGYYARTWREPSEMLLEQDGQTVAIEQSGHALPPWTDPRGTARTETWGSVAGGAGEDGIAIVGPAIIAHEHVVDRDVRLVEVAQGVWEVCTLSMDIMAEDGMIRRLHLHPALPVPLPIKAADAAGVSDLVLTLDQKQGGCNRGEQIQEGVFRLESDDLDGLAVRPPSGCRVSAMAVRLSGKSATGPWAKIWTLRRPVPTEGGQALVKGWYAGQAPHNLPNGWNLDQAWTVTEGGGAERA